MVHWLSPFHGLGFLNILQEISDMGKTESKEEKIEISGAVNNNVILTNTDTVNVYSKELVYLVAGMLFMQVVQFLALIYLKHKRHLKKVYTNRGTQSK